MPVGIETAPPRYALAAARVGGSAPRYLMLLGRRSLAPGAALCTQSFLVLAASLGAGNRSPTAHGARGGATLPSRWGGGAARS
eukprot:5468872-Prymnesium_polylepis.1